MRHQVKRLLAVAPVLVVVAAGVAACGGQETGTAQPGVSTGSSQASGSDSSAAQPPASSGAAGAGNGPLAGTDPCSLLPQQFLGQLGVGQGRPGQVDPGVSRGCDYEGQSYGVSVVIFDTLGIYRPDAPQQGQPITVNGGAHTAKQRATVSGTGCAISMEVTGSSSVDVISEADGGEQRSCQLATLVAQAVEPQLPKS